ncbi:hypothetical protein MNBD_NITROSPINAE02-789 [hydrothermal vent metagenome]|uniref:PKD domain-containing protein n=1 Tax=hydrothermal vent metagenome TaxID=652676 RepID=A0A3B1CYC5_9ZZZZ
MKKEKIIIFKIAFAVIALAVATMGCDVINPPEKKTQPTAKIKIDAKTVQIGSQVTLNGKGSSDPQSELLTYAWTMPEKPVGSTAALSSETNSIVTFVADNGGYYTVTLQVKNKSGKKSSVKTARVDAVGSGNNHPPVANAGPDQTAVDVGAVAILDASGSYDADQDQLTFLWSILSIPATSAITQVVDARQMNAYLYPDVAGDYYIKLWVGDGADADLDFVTITAK